MAELLRETNGPTLLYFSLYNRVETDLLYEQNSIFIVCSIFYFLLEHIGYVLNW